MNRNHRIIHVYVSEEEYDMFADLLEQMSNGKEEKNGDIISMVKMDDEKFNALISFVKKLIK